MSWLNNSLVTIKGQLTHLAQEVLADTAGPGDDEYRGPDLNTKTAVELLAETQELKEQLEKSCEDKDREIATLRKQLATLKTSQKISEAGAGGDVDGATRKSLQSGDDQNVEDSWFWEPAGSEAAATGPGKCPSDASLVEVALPDTPDVSRLNLTIANLERDNEELRHSLDMLDAQHEQAMQNMLGQKTELQAQLQELKQLQADRLVAHELEMARLKAQLANEQKQQQTVALEREQLQQRVEQQGTELQRCMLELAEMQQLLEKRGADNGELIERVRQADAERDKLQRELEELVKQSKEKKTSESSTSSSTGKHSEDEFIVVRNTDATGSSSDPDPDPDVDADADGDVNVVGDATKEALLNKLAEMESSIAEMRAINAKLQDGQLERQLAENVRNEQLDELETRLRISECEKEQLQLELQRKLQQLTMQNQELKLNAEADQETHANDLEQQLGALRAENRQLRQELDSSIAQAKFRQAIAEEKQEITDLDMDLDLDALSLAESSSSQLMAMLEALVADKSRQSLDRTYHLLNDRLKHLDMADRDVMDLRKQLLIAEHDKKTLEADISQYVLQCDELMKNNEALLNEMDKVKRNKLETIEEHHEETIAQLEQQLEESQLLLQHQQQQLAEKQREIEELRSKHPRDDSPQLERLRRELEDVQRAKHAQEAQMGLQLEQLRADLRAKQEQLELKLKENANAMAEVGTLQIQLDAQQEALHESTERGEQLEAQLKQLQKQSEHSAEAEQELEELRDQLQTSELQLLESRRQGEQLKVELEELQSQLGEAAELRTQLEEKTAQLQQQEQQQEQLQSQLNELQALCKQQQIELKDNPTLRSLREELEARAEQLTQLEEERKQLQARAEQSEQLQQQLDELQAKLEALQQAPTDGADVKQKELEQQLEQLRALHTQEMAQLQQSIDALNGEKQELIKALQQKHVENTQYYAEIQRLQPLEQQLRDLIKEREKLCDQINFLKEKSDILTTNLLTEQSNQRLLQQQQIEAQEQQATLQRDLERLRAHLVEIEELHTQESVELQRELDEARAKHAALQTEVSKSSTAYTSASIRANQQAETLQAQHALLMQQRDELLAKIGQFEDREQKQQAALTNLQCALEQFQNDKEHEITLATQRIRREMQAQLEQQAHLQSELNALQQQLAEANQGLRAASRLSDQLEAGQQTIAVLRDEVDSLKEANRKLEQSLSSSESSQTDKIDKSLIKSLLIGYVVSGNAGDKQQVLRMISSLLDFSAQESDKVGLNKPQSSWLGNILGGGGGASSSASSGNDNLVQAFVKFLEQESQPQSTAQARPNLLSMAKQTDATEATSAGGGGGGAGDVAAAAAIASPAQSTSATAIATTTASTGHATPPVSVLPPMQPLLMNSNEFAPTRNSSSILKDILSDT
ncbi:hypothetical protein AWZ03_011571 [Drosophila navojoa]|uniref:GRIP domain-containing protein n=1 Tax=Drosophila navojoa TaxID=7232 RepID=A0A484AZE9_DRONA|nr:trichohyalin [Drosophila navojoa]TDG41997.1 hypothetical protein AWZ03_011571 [Drosophila navojoa]